MIIKKSIVTINNLDIIEFTSNIESELSVQL